MVSVTKELKFYSYLISIHNVEIVAIGLDRLGLKLLWTWYFKKHIKMRSLCPNPFCADEKTK